MAKFNDYCSDMSRTVPISGAFSKEQLEVYNWVYCAYQSAMEEVKIGNSLQAIHKAVEKMMRGE